MAATLTLDQIEGSELLLDLDGQSRRVRMGTVEGIDVVGDADPNVLEKALAVTGMPGMGNAMPGNPTFSLSQVGVVGIFHNCCRVRLVYRPVEFAGLPASAYVITDGSSLVQENTSIHYKTKLPIRVGYSRTVALPPGVAGPPVTYTIPEQSVEMAVPWPMRKVQLQALIAGSPDGSKNYTGYVNSGSWPITFTPLGVGYWLIDNFQSSYSRYQGFYQITASAISRNFRNWMMQGTLIDKNTGTYVQVEDSAVDAALNLAYTATIVKTAGTGIVSVGHYPTVDFATVFGF